MELPCIKLFDLYRLYGIIILYFYLIIKSYAEILMILATTKQYCQVHFIELYSPLVTLFHENLFY